MKKEIYTIPHRLNESLGTQELVKRNLIKVIYDIDEFVEKITNKKLSKTDDEILLFCKTNPTYESAISKFPNEILEYELDGKINIKNGKIFLN